MINWTWWLYFASLESYWNRCMPHKPQAEKCRRSVSLYWLINLSSCVSYGSFNSFLMSSNFTLTLQLNSVQCLFLMQWNIEARGNILKEGQRVGKLCREPNDVCLIMGGKRACRRISSLLVSHKLPAAFFFLCSRYFFTEIFLHKILMSRTTELSSEIHFIMLIHTHFPFIIERFNDTLKCASQEHAFHIQISHSPWS